MTSNLLKDNFRSSTGDDGKSGKSSKMNVDCDKTKLGKSDIYDSNGKRIDGSSLGELMRKKQKRPRDEKSSDGNSNSSPSVGFQIIFWIIFNLLFRSFQFEWNRKQ